MGGRRITVLARLLLPAWFLFRLNAQQSASPPVCPSEIHYRGADRNYNYGFTITIPEGLEGFWNSPPCSNGPEGCGCMTDHGRIIPLTPAPYEPQRHIEVFAGYATRDHPAVALQVKEKLKQMREMSRENSVEVRTRSGINLSGARAQRLVVRYYDKKLTGWFVEDFVEVLRNGIEYSLYLRTKEASYPQDRVVFERLVSSFSFTLE